ncbi:MoxR family ATPase [Archaeoglobales archaeon]|nr:MAG: MoxR family ATPase [Archaeoglobales archaeon]
MSTLQDIYNTILLPGREEEAKVLMLALVSKQHAVMIGPPGTGKSLLIKRLARNFQVPYFEYLLTKFTLPEELFGVPNVKMLREQGEYQLITRNKLPEARLAFIDEIFKGSSAILNSLLGILNEREFFNGQKIVKCPLWTCMTASNEIPEEPELQALWDRLSFRIWAKNLQKDLWDDYLTAYWTMHQPQYQKIAGQNFDFKVIEDAHSALWQVDVFTVKAKYLEILAKLEDDHNIIVSDRRKGRGLIALASNAILNQRQTVIPEDLLTLKYILPEKEEEVRIVEQVIVDIAGKMIKAKQQLQELVPQIQGMLNDLKNASSFDEAIQIAERLKPIRAKLLDLESIIPEATELVEIKQLLDEFNNVLVEKVKV